MNRNLLWGAALASLVLGSVAIAAPPNSSIAAKNASGSTETLGAVTDGTLKSPSHSVVDSTGAVVNPATSGNQTTANTSLSSIDSKLTGAATAAKQPALGTAGTPSADVLTVQGSASGTAIPGSVADGADVAQGAKAENSCSTDTGTCSVLALIKRLNASITTLNGKLDTLHTDMGSAIGAGSAVIGKVGIDQTTDGSTNAVHLVAGTALAGKVGFDQTTPGSTNGVQDAATGSTGSAVGSKAIYAGAQSGGNLTGIIQANSSAFLNMTTATTTKIITGVSAKKVYVSAFRLHAGGTTTAKFVEGTGTNCGTGTADLSETFDFTASDGSNQGNGLGPVLVAATAGDDICVVNSAAVNLRAGVAYEIH